MSEIALLDENRILESAKRRIEGKKSALIAIEMEGEIARAVKKAVARNRKMLQAMALEAVEAELADGSFRVDVKKAIVRQLKNEMREENLPQIFPDLMVKVGEAMIRAILR